MPPTFPALILYFPRIAQSISALLTAGHSSYRLFFKMRSVHMWSSLTSGHVNVHGILRFAMPAKSMAYIFPQTGVFAE